MSRRIIMAPLWPPSGSTAANPRQALPEPSAKRVRHPGELLLDRGVVFGHRGDELVAQFGDRFAGQCPHQAGPAAEMVQNQRMRDPGGGDVVQPQPFGRGAGDRPLRRVEDQPPGLIRRAADPLDLFRHVRGLPLVLRRY
jgi:hypothetical protein